MYGKFKVEIGFLLHAVRRIGCGTVPQNLHSKNDMCMERELLDDWKCLGKYTKGN